MAMLWPTLEFVLGLSLMITLLVGAHEVVSHRISVGQFTAFNVYMVQLTWPMIAVGWVVNLFQRGTASVVRLDDLPKPQPSIADDPSLINLNAAPAAEPGTPSSLLSFRTLSEAEGKESVSLPPQQQVQGDIEFRNLTFAYPDAPSVLHDINLSIPARTSLAIVGPTGSGKPTLVSLITPLPDPPPAPAPTHPPPPRTFPPPPPPPTIPP